MSSQKKSEILQTKIAALKSQLAAADAELKSEKKSELLRAREESCREIIAAAEASGLMRCGKSRRDLVAAFTAIVAGDGVNHE